MTVEAVAGQTGRVGRRKRVLLGVGVAALVVAAAVVGGVLASKAAARNKQQQQAVVSRGSVNLSKLQELPPPGSMEAQQLTTSSISEGYIRDVYTYFQDSNVITEQMTESFLKQLQEQLTANPELLGSTSNSTIDLQPFIDVAADILNYFRYSDSQALLQLLRQYSASNGTQQIMLSDVNPDVLQTEVHQLLANISSIDQYYRDTSNKGCKGRASGSGGNATHSSSRTVTEAAVNMSQQQPQDPAEMLCSVREYSPSGLTGMSLPGPSAGIPCSAAKAAVPAAPFGQVELPVVFHVFRFGKDDRILPPVWGAEAAGKRLIQATNNFFRGSGIRFKLQEVRYDPMVYGYLMFTNKAEWQKCSMSNYRPGEACLVETAEMPEVAALIADNVINIFVSGSPTHFCDPETDAESRCKSVLLGYSQADGGWFEEPPVVYPDWRESDQAMNWMWISYDEMFGGKPWQGGAATVTHELGHYLGLMHTFQQQQDATCDDIGDGVPDTPAGQNLQDFKPARRPDVYYELERFCVQFRKGQKPDTDILFATDSCPGKKGVDPVTNVMNYIPDACVMTFTPSQVQRLQRMAQTYRPQMVKQYQVK